MLDAPLIGPYHQDGILAWEIDGPRTAREFVSDVACLADSLPDRPHILNLLSSRYEFLVGLAAAMLRRQVTLLPQSRAPETLRRIAGDYDKSYCLTNRGEPVEGIESVSGGEGPWIRGLKLVTPGVLIAGTNPVCTDAVATALMGFDPGANRGTPPFENCDSMPLNFNGPRRRAASTGYQAPQTANSRNIIALNLAYRPVSIPKVILFSLSRCRTPGLSFSKPIVPSPA